MSCSPTFTAAQIAAIVGRSKRSILLAMGTIPATEVVQVAGNAANAWALDVMPEALRVEMRRARPDGKYWVCPVAWDQIKAEDRAKAAKLQRALAPALARRNSLLMTPTEKERSALDDYQREFGYEISARHLRRLFDRTLKRDCGGENFERVELFLDDAALVPTKPGRDTVAIEQLHRELKETIDNLECREKPTVEDRAFLFHAAFEHFEQLTAREPNKPEHARLKRSLVAYLFSSVPALSKSAAALQRVFELKLTEWRTCDRSPAALMDARRSLSGNFRKPEFAEDQKKIRNLAILHGGNESLAHRLLRQSGQLSREFIEYYAFDGRRNKSYVPKAIREEITPEVDMCGPIHRGPWEARMRGPYIPRDWSDVLPCDWFSGDDVTWNNYFYFYDEAGQLHIERGECLLMTDLRSGYPLDFALIAGKYNGRYIRSLITKIHDRIGLPRKGFYFENSIWSSRFIDGDRRNQSHFRETERGLLEAGLGIEVRHTKARNPRSKPIEGIFRILQERQRSEPGFAGANERTEKIERLQEFIQRARRGKEHPGNELLEMDEWVKRITKTLGEFASDPQNGIMLDGLAPREAWDGEYSRGLKKLGEKDRYILATHKRPVKISQRGILLRIGSEDALYCNEETGKRIGREVLAFYNIDHPDLLTVSDMNRQNFFSVKRVKLPALSATSEQMRAAHAQVNGHMKAARTIYSELPHERKAWVERDDHTSDEVKALGEFHNVAERQHQTEQRATERTLRKIQRTAAAAGIAVSGEKRNPERVLTGVEREIEYRARLAAKKEVTNGTD